MSLKFKRLFSLLAIFLSFIPRSHAQICTGSLGDPVVNITFGAGSNPGNPLTVSLPNLSYVSHSCPDDGFYTIANNSPDCFGSSWHIVQEDHTPGDNNGYMMVVNASFNSGDFYVDTVKGLCSGTTYEFAAWLMNVMLPSACGGTGITPNLTFNIESPNGTVLGTYKTGNIPHSASPVWQQYGLFFKTPAGASTVVLRITNNAPGGCGNDLILDDITFRPCGPTVTSFVASNNTSSIDRCAYDQSTVLLSATVSAGYNNPSYQWQQSANNGSWTDIPGATTLSYTYTPSGTAGVYKYRLAVAEAGNIGNSICRIVSNVTTITVHDKPATGIGSNSPVCTQQNILLHANTAASYKWTGPANFSSAIANPVIPATLSATGKYYLEIADTYGCKNKDSTSVTVRQTPVAQTAGVINACKNDSAVLTASGGTNYLWSPATGLSATNIASPKAFITDTIVYTVVVGTNGCSDTASVTVNAQVTPLANAGADKYLFEGQSTTLNGTASGANLTISWTPPIRMIGGNTLTPTVNPVDNITYKLTVQSGLGCGSASDDVFVRVFKKLVIPSAFSPNGDGINDDWRIDALLAYPESSVSVFDRFGQLVYKSTGYNKPWNGTRSGKPLPVDTYYYIIDLKNNLPLVQGSVFIIR